FGRTLPADASPATEGLRRAPGGLTSGGLVWHSFWNPSGIVPVEPAIAVDQLVKVYGASRAVDGISFALAPGSMTGLLGGNGAGKTTTIAMILGLVMPTAGSAKVLGPE